MLVSSLFFRRSKNRFDKGLTNARIIFIPEDRKQFAYLGPGVGSLAQPLEEQSEEMEMLQVSWLSWVVKTAPQDEGPLQEEEEDDAAIEAGDAHGREPRGGRRRTWPTAQRRGGGRTASGEGWGGTASCRALSLIHI